MKLISLNIEGKKHLDRVLPFLETELPAVICLQEAPEDLQDWLTQKNYHVTFAPMTCRTTDTHTFREGVLIASALPHIAQTHYYFGHPNEIRTYDSEKRRDSIAHVVICATVGDYTIATTHLPAPPHGELFYEPLATDIAALRSHLSSVGPHILVGDMNTPRGINPSYPDLVADYTDHIPPSYTSSLDRALHRLGTNPEKTQLFDSFMVDYLFSTPEYTATDVRLQFGLSDHAGIVAEVKLLST